MPRRSAGLERIVFFSDAVMAIAITLLILEVRLPDGAADLGRRMLALWPKFLGYFVSFWVIALYWIAHHRCFMLIRTYDRGLLLLNFLFLLFIAFLPFPTGVLFSNPTQVTSVALYAGTAAGMGLAMAWLWIHAVRRRLLAPNTPPRTIRNIRLNLLLPPLIFLATVAAAFVDVRAATYGWLLLVPLYIVRRLRERSPGRKA